MECCYLVWVRCILYSIHKYTCGFSTSLTGNPGANNSHQRCYAVHRAIPLCFARIMRSICCTARKRFSTILRQVTKAATFRTLGSTPVHSHKLHESSLSKHIGFINQSLNRYFWTPFRLVFILLAGVRI